MSDLSEIIAIILLLFACCIVIASVIATFLKKDRTKQPMQEDADKTLIQHLLQKYETELERDYPLNFMFYESRVKERINQEIISYNDICDQDEALFIIRLLVIKIFRLSYGKEFVMHSGNQGSIVLYMAILLDFFKDYKNSMNKKTEAFVVSLLDEVAQVAHLNKTKTEDSVSTLPYDNVKDSTCHDNTNEKMKTQDELEFDVDAFIADLPGELREFAEDYPEEAKFNLRCMMLMMQKSKDYLKPKEALSTQRENRRQQWYGDTECDICHREIHNNLYDAQRRDINSEWATMCENCFKRFGIAVRWGIGQKYKQESDGNFYLIDGFPPEEQL